MKLLHDIFIVILVKWQLVHSYPEFHVLPTVQVPVFSLTPAPDQPSKVVTNQRTGDIYFVHSEMNCIKIIRKQFIDPAVQPLMSFEQVSRNPHAKTFAGQCCPIGGYRNGHAQKEALFVNPSFLSIDEFNNQMLVFEHVAVSARIIVRLRSISLNDSVTVTLSENLDNEQDAPIFIHHHEPVQQQEHHHQHEEVQKCQCGAELPHHNNVLSPNPITNRNVKLIGEINNNDSLFSHYPCPKDMYNPTGDFTKSNCVKCPLHARCSPVSFACLAGFEVNEQGLACQECKRGFIKVKINNSKCLKCPDNSVNCTATDFECMPGYLKNSPMLACDSIRSRSRSKSMVSQWIRENTLTVFGIFMSTAVTILISVIIMCLKLFEYAELKQQEERARFQSSKCQYSISLTAC